MKLHGFNYAAQSIRPGPRTAAPPPPSRGTRLLELIQPKPGDWRLRALCRGQTRGPNSPWMNPAAHEFEVVQACLSLCARCPVRGECERMPRPVGITGGFVWTVATGTKPAKMLARQCRWCRRSFFGERVGASYCSTDCTEADARDLERRGVKKRACTICGDKFTPPRKDSKTCSFGCRKELENRGRGHTPKVVTGANSASSVTREKARSACDALTPSENPDITEVPMSTVLDPSTPVQNPGGC